MASGRYQNTKKSLLLVTLMILMTQVGYLENLNPWINGEESLDDAETVLQTGGQGSANYSLAQSSEGEALALNAAMDPITFGYVEGEDASTIEGNGSYWNFTEGYASSTLGNRISTLGDGYDVMFDDDVIMFNDASDLYMHNLSNGTTWNEFSHYGFVDFLYVLDNVLLFDSYVSYYVSELWAYNVSNGTKWNIGGADFELPSFTLNSNTFNPSPLRVGDDLYLYGEDTNGPGEGLYRFNGTSLELEFLSNSTSPSTSFSNLKNLIHHNGTVYFTAQESGTYRWDLFKHTIATNQTSMLHDVTGGSTSSSNYGFQAQVTMVPDDIIVFGYSGLWAYNITSNTSYQVNSSLGGNLNEAVVVDDVVYFSAGVDRELYAYNLSTNATWMVKNINTNNGKDGLISNEGPDILVRDGKLYFIGLTGWQDTTSNYQIWVHDTQENATYSIDNGYSNGRGASWFHGFTRDQLFYYYDKSSGYDDVYMYDISTNETSYVLREGSSQYGGGYWTFAGDVFVYSGHSGSWDSKMYLYSPEELSVVSFDAVVGASCSISPSLPAGLSLNQGNCTVSGTPTTITSQTSYTLTATISGQTYGATFWLITDYLPLTPSVADLDATVGAPIEPITFGIRTGAKAGDGGYDAPYNSNYSTMLAGDYHSCALLGDGSMACWGDNQYGQLGDGTTTSSSTPVPVNLPAGSSVASIPAYAADHSCAILDNGSVYCWGLGSAFSTGSSVSTPQHLPLPAGRTPVSIEADHHSTCVILDNGSMMCVGGNTYNRLGYNGSATGTFAYVEYLPQGAIVVDMSLSENSACALLDDGDVWCWGYNSYEALGVSGGGTTYNYAVQPNIPSGNISAIEGHVRGHCSLYDNGSVACWGSNSNGERGIGNFSTDNLAILGIQFTQPMPGNLPVTSIATGDHTVCAQLSNGSVACWGDYYANGYTSDTHTPTLIPWPHGSVQAKAVSVGWYHGCALLENGSMWCWGQNSYGQLGDGTTTHSVSGTFVDLDQGVRGPPVSMSGATCSVDPALPAGLSMTQGNCTISGTPTGLSSTTTYTVYANTSAGTSRSEISITVVANPLFPSVEGADLSVDVPMTNITFQYNASAASGSGSGSNSGTYNGNGTAWMVKDIRSGSSSSSPQHLTAVGSTLYFSANDGTNEVELWKSDGTASGTVLVKDIRSGSSSSSPQHLTAVGSTIFFAATDGTNGMELWKSDGTASGTVLVKDIYSGGSSSSPQHLTAVGSTLYFIANDGTNGDELWKSDGTSSGTVMVKDIYSGSGGGAPSSLTAIGNTLYFRANDWINGAELWKSDGTASGTVMVKDINSGSNGGNPGFLTAVGSTLYFTASDGTNGSELWKSDGTASGTVMVKNIRIGTSSGNPTNLKAVGSTLYFTASDGTNGTELWKSDGTASGTVMVKDIYSGYLSSSPIRLTAVGSTLYFIANDGTNGYELWKSDGTSVGTVMVKDIWSGSSSTSPHHLTAVGNTLFFQATDGTNGYELWKSDGTASGTVMAIDINSGGNSFPSYLTAVGNTLYFRASEGTNGNELWALDPANITGLSGGSGSGSGGGMTDVTGASCSVSPALPTGLSIDSNTCTISGTPTAETSNTTYTVTAVISGVTYQGSVWLSSSYLELTPSAEGADLYLDVPMTNVTFEYDVSAASGSSTGSGSGASTSSAFAYANDKLATGSFHTCAILDNGDLKCWGRDDQGQLGDGGTTHSYTTHTTSPPAIVIDLGTGRTAVAVDIGEKHTCAILDNGDLKCWGRDNHGALGNGGSKTDTYAPSTTAIDLGTGRTAVAVSCGIDHTCALLDNGEIKCWGLDDKGQLGDGGTSTSLTHTTSPSTPVNLGTGRTAVAVSAGHSHTCAILDNGDVKCWGNNIKGQLGIGNTTNMGVRPGDMGDNLNTVDLGTGRTAVAVYGGYLHTCAILDNGDLKCWGSDQYGELGDGGSTHTSSTYTTSPSAIPIDLGPGRTAVAVHAESHTCALLDNGDVKCWGWDYKGQLGDGGSNSDRAAPPSTPIDLGSGRTAVSVSAGVYHSCAILDNGDIKCWGGDGYGQLGDGGSNSDQSSPVSVSGSNTWDSSTGLIIGVTGATCSISPSLPTGLSIDSSTCTISGTPTVETSNTTYTVTAVISGVTYQGSVWLSTSPYGNITSTVEGAHLNLGEAMTPITLNYTVNANASSGSSGGSGSGSGSGSSTSSTSSFVYANDKISSGGQHTCAILDNGEMKCWGMNTYGQLGIGFNIGGVSSNGNHLQPPSITIDFGTGRTPVKVSSGGLHACALLDNDDVKCWGSRGEGRLGIGGSGSGTEPEPPTTAINFGTSSKVIDVGAGGQHSCALLENGDVKCWGRAYRYRLGLTSSSDFYQPGLSAILPTGRTAVAMDVGLQGASCVILDSGNVSCWGEPHGSYQPYVEIGVGTGRQAVAISVGDDHYCIILDNGDLKCWGSDQYGQLGDGGPAWSTSNPTSVSAPPSTAINLGAGRTAVALATGERHTCAILDNGEVKCWGGDSYGQLGNGPTITANQGSPSSTSVDLGTGRTAVAISAGNHHTCAILDNGDMKCWGGDYRGQLGDGGTATNQESPGSVAGNNAWDTTTTAVTWETHPALPAGMSISAGVISGTPSVYALNQTYTIYANQSGYSTTHELYFSVDTDNAHTVVENQTIDPIGFHPPFNNGTTCWSVSPALPGNLSIDSSTGEITGSVNGTLTNTTYTVTANHGCTGSGTGGGSGNGTIWTPTPPSGISTGPNAADYFMLEHDGVIYFDANSNNGKTVFAYSTVNQTMWIAYDISHINSASSFSFETGKRVAQFIGDDLFFSMKNSTNSKTELWVYSTSNGTTWQAMTQSQPSGNMEFVIGNRLYFVDSYYDGSNFIPQIAVYDTSNHTYWNYSTTMFHGGLSGGATCDAPGENFHALVGDTIYFDACDASQSYGNEMYAFNTVNGTYWRVADLDNGTDHSWPGKHMHIVIGDTIYFDAQVGNPSTVNAHALWAYNTSNGSTWLAADVNEPGRDMRDFSIGQNNELPRREPVVIGDTMYFDAKGAHPSTTPRTNIGSTCTYGHQEIYAYNIGNQTAWCVADAGGLGWGTSADSNAGHNMLTLVGDILLFDADFAYSPTSGARLNSLWAHNLSNGTTWEISSQANPSVLSEVGNGHPAFSVNNALYFPAQNNSGREVWGYDIVNQTYWLVNDTCPGGCSGMTGGNYHTLVYQGVFYSSVRISQNGVGEQYILGVFNPVPSSSTSSGGSGGGSGSGSGSGGSTGTGATETFTFNLQSLADYDGDGLPNDLPGDYDAAEGPTPGLVADTDDDADGLLDTVETNTGTYVDSSDTGTDPLNPDTDGDGICDGPIAVPGVCIAGPDTNSGATVVDTPIVLLNNSDVDEIAPFYPVTGATYGLSPALPTSMQFDASNGSIWGTPDMVMANTTYTMWANLSDGTSTSWTFFLEVLEDLDGDGMPDVLPGDYNATNDPIRTPGLEEDLDDDGDGYNDTAETDTGLYLDGNNTGTDPRDPDTDDDGICDGPNAVPGVCVAGPDLTPFGPPATVVAVNNTMIPSVPPYYAGSGLTYEVTPDLPAGLTIDPSNGFLMGVPTETTGNITYTVYANHSDGTSYSWDFTIEVLEDSDGDGSPDTLPADYDGDNDSIRAPPGLTEDLDDDNDGMSDEDEIANGTLPLNPDTDGDGFCDGINAVPGVCFAGPDPYPNDPTLPLDTDGDGLPDDDSGWTGPPYADEDDDNDGYPDVSEDACGSDSLDANSIPDDMDGDTICDGDDDDMDGDGIDNVNETGDTTVPPGTSPINPDTDGDGICDGPESPVTSNCTAGPDMFPLDPSAWEDTDGDGYPNELFPPSNSTPPLEEDLDDDNDGWSDIDEVNCGSDPVNASDMPVDQNGDGICDVLDLDWDDDGIPNANETDTGVYVDASDTGTDPWNPDTDGDGFCDGPFAVMNGTEMICAAGPDPFPHDPNMPMDTDGDGLPNELPEDYIGNLVEDTDDDDDGYSDVSELNCDSDPLDATSTPTNDLDGDGLCDAEDPDVDGDGLSNETELAEGSLTSYMNADTDGDGVCDGPSAPALPAGICVAGPDAFPDDPAAWLDTDGDGDPDELVDSITTDLVLDTDDDNDGWEDVDELACGTNSKDVMSTPFDGDDDGICDVLDTQTLGYTINDAEAEMFEAYVNQSDFVLMPNLTGMEPGLWTIEPALPAGLSFSGTARSGETGIITGIPTEASPMTNYTVTADNGRVNISFTFGLGVLNDTDGDRLPDEPSLTGLEEDLDDDNDGHLDEIEVKCGSDPLNQTSVPNVDEDGNCIEGKYADDDSDDDSGFLMCLMPLCLILLLALLLLALLFRDKVVLMGPEPENTTSDPAFLSGAGTKDDPFVLKPVKALKAGSTVEAKETISIVNMSPEIRVNLLDLAEATNDKRFRMYEVDGTSEEPGFNLEADDEGRLRLRFVFDDSDDPTYPGGTYNGLLKLGKASVYLSWTVDVKEDKRMMNKIRKEQEAAEKAEKEAKEAEEKAKAEAEAKEAEEKAKAEAEAKAAEEKAAKEAEKKAKAEEKAAAAALAKKEKEEAAAKKKEEAAAKKAKEAEEKATKEAEEAEAKAKAEAEAKDAEEKAAKEAEEKAKADEKAAAAAAAAAAKKAKEEEEAKKKAEAEAKEAEAKAAKEAEEKAKAEAAAKKKAEKKPATTKEAKKQEELQRVKQRAKTIDFKVIGEAESSELKSEVKKGATTLEVANAKDFAESGSAEINDAKGSTIIAWTGKDGNTLTGVSGVTRVFAAKAVLMVKDDLQVIKGIGPFLEEKLNALGITTYRQLANMNAKLEEQVNEAIEFFPGRVKRDQWVAQAKILLGEDVKLDEKALKQAEELERIAQKAEGIDFAILGVASASEADDLQKIKGIGPFIAEKLNALGIYKFSQLANMTSEIEEEVNVAIEFFPGRVKRDEWAKQAKEFAKD